METSKSRMATRVQTLMRDLEKLKIAKEALKMNITTRNTMRELTEPAELHDVVKSKRKINKKGEYRMGGKIKKLSDNQMKLYKENYGKGAIARALRNKYQESGDVTKQMHVAESGGLQGMLVEFAFLPPQQQQRLINQANQSFLTNPINYVHNQTLVANNPQGTTPPATTNTKPKSTKVNYNKDVKDFRLYPDGTIVPSTLKGADTTLLSYEKDKNGSPVLKTMKGVESFDAATGEIKFTNDASGKAAQKIYDAAGNDPQSFIISYIEEANNEMLLKGKPLSYKELYSYIKQNPELAKTLGNFDKKYGKKHEEVLNQIDKDDFKLWDDQGQSTTWVDDKTEAVEDEISFEEEDGEEIVETEETEETETEETETQAADGKSKAKDVTGTGDDLFGDYDLGMTTGEKIGLATGAAGRLGGIAAALSNRPQQAYNAFAGVGDRAEDSIREGLRKSRTGIEQTAAQIKAQGNLARKVARDTSNSWAQRYAASLGAQRLTDEGLIKNRNMWERLYGDMKGRQAQVQLRGDMAEAQGAMQVQDWFQRDKDSYLTGLAQEGQNLTNYGASVAGLANMKQMRNQQLQALRDMGIWFKPQIDPSGNISINYG